MFKKNIYCKPIILDPLINRIVFVKTIVNSGYLYYRLCNPTFTRKTNLKYIRITLFYIEAFNREKAKRLI